MRSRKGRGADARRRSRTARTLLGLAIAAVIVPNTGCSMWSGITRRLSRHDALDECIINYRNQAWAARAWLCTAEEYRNRPYLSDFEAGFRQGYEDIAAGGNGCVPAVCPKAYWGWQYQSSDGQSRMNAWFEGYPLGVKAAEQDGVGNWNSVATSMPVPQLPPKTPAAAPAVADPSVMNSPANLGGRLFDGDAPPAPTKAPETLPTPPATKDATLPPAKPQPRLPNELGSASPADAAKPKGLGGKGDEKAPGREKGFDLPKDIKGLLEAPVVPIKN